MPDRQIISGAPGTPGRYALSSGMRSERLPPGIPIPGNSWTPATPENYCSSLEAGFLADRFSTGGSPPLVPEIDLKNAGSRGAVVGELLQVVASGIHEYQISPLEGHLFHQGGG